MAVTSGDRLGFAGLTANGTAIASEIAPNLGLYVQDQWTGDRITVNAGVRFDYQQARYPDQIVGVSRYRAAPFPIDGDTPPKWSDLQPRLGVAYELFGDGRTAVKASANRYSRRFGIVQGDPLTLAAIDEDDRLEQAFAPLASDVRPRSAQVVGFLAWPEIPRSASGNWMSSTDS